MEKRAQALRDSDVNYLLKLPSAEAVLQAVEVALRSNDWGMTRNAGRYC
jgi:hypothetical protein